MTDLEYILKSSWNDILTRDMLNIGISAYDYMRLISWLEQFNGEPAKTQEITDNIIESYFN